MGFKNGFLGSVRERRSGFGQRKKTSGWVFDCGFNQGEKSLGL